MACKAMRVVSVGGILNALQNFSSAAVAEQDDVAFLDDVVAAFEAHLGFFTCGGDAARGEKIVPAHDFRADETFFDVAVNFACGFDGGGAFSNGPRADFRLARGEIRNQAHQLVGGVNQAIEAGFFQAVGCEQLGGFFFFHLRELGFEASANGHDRGIGSALQCAEFVALDRGGKLGGFVVAKIQHVEHGTLRQKQKSADGLALFGRQFQLAQGLFGFQMRFALFEDGFFELRGPDLSFS